MTERRRWDLLAFGDPCMDLNLEVDQWPEAGGKVMARAAGHTAGGTTANAACALARLGGRAAVFGRIGADPFGELLRRSLREDGVDVEHLQVAPGLPTGLAVSLLPPGGDRGLVVAPMAAAPPPFPAQRLHDALLQSRVVYAMPRDQAELSRISQLARGTRTRVALDLEPAVAGDPQTLAQRLPFADVVFFNEAGFRAGTGEAPSAEGLRRLLAHGPSCVVVTLGAQGAMAVDRGGAVRQAAFDVPVRDTTGAGDAFNAAFVLAHLEGQPLAACLRFACAASSFVIAEVGARAGLPSRAAVDARLDQARSRRPDGADTVW
jgi:ribokinase/sulfofructose kinase